MHRRGVLEIRPEWFTAVVDTLQATAGRLLTADRSDLPSLLELFVHTLPKPKGRAEPLILGWFLVEFAAEHGNVVHQRIHQAAHSSSCRFDVGLHLQCFWRPRRLDPVEGFTKWVRSFFKQLDAVHPLSSANQAAAVIRKQYRHQWSTTELASRVHSKPVQLARDFRREYGISIREYLRNVRTVEAIHRVHDENVDVVAMEVGYRGKKNFYRAL